MNRRPTVSRAAVRQQFPALLAALVLALTLCAFPVATANAAPCTPGQAICLGPGASDDPTPTQAPPTDPAPAPADPKPAPTIPTQPAAVPVAPEPAPPAATVEPSLVASESAISTSTVTPIPSSAAPTTSGAGASTEPNWNKPIESTSKAKQAAVVVGNDGPGTDVFGLISIMGGVLLVGLGGLAFALWSRNRISSH